MQTRSIFKVILFFNLLIGTRELYSTQFLPSSIEDQLLSSSAVIWGYYNDETYKKLPTGQVVTEASFSVIKYAGAIEGETFNQHAFKVLFPGGVWEDIVYDISGAPSFSSKEEVILLLRKDGYGHWITNLSMGKYGVQKQLDGTYLMSAIFPDHPQLGKIAMADFERQIEERFHEKLHFIINGQGEIFPNKTGSKQKEIASAVNGRSGRMPASEESIERENQISMFWLMIIFSLLGLLSSYLVKLRK
ncbi:MAG: hypothetical protein A2504_06765 [Bdellovibrionales bacterium RIFOXYD12_FULL_39_22]|nr:MAG: hypothetical protein A2385_09085 [Bdellovibrionales bacterium RIFOXYB1_FULL_39_21]OFZ45149.1 MAG: hypothetical protein A2485_05455 [Bdellovibrionales bacterium RIFOXYC12_FULL_39_17]OFZ45659.1 MAG: hypothetical protein A2404_03665 [Bdellovibrionales bacterium RIFOXYC1_FULL_39_130]OFZ68047.1 MAG: hypothetical protein A2451_10920 [Bdellovibrionales bacterium RIFOXYC2_FULL_39_8]OFZ77521.1 MAG: hypothetical protein A2560_09250 [Bdellovibrionales bacterium RIFOXYD1_FULL_39_84]OFZ91650.1 MAG: